MIKVILRRGQWYSPGSPLKNLWNKMITNSCSDMICSVPFFGGIMEGLVRPRTYLDQGHLMSHGHVTNAVTTGAQAQKRTLCFGLMLCSHHPEIVNFDFVKEVHWENEACTMDLGLSATDMICSTPYLYLPTSLRQILVHPLPQCCPVF